MICPKFTTIKKNHEYYVGFLKSNLIYLVLRRTNNKKQTIIKQTLPFF